MCAHTQWKGPLYLSFFFNLHIITPKSCSPLPQVDWFIILLPEGVNQRPGLTLQCHALENSIPKPWDQLLLWTRVYVCVHCDRLRPFRREIPADRINAQPYHAGHWGVSEKHNLKTTNDNGQPVQWRRLASLPMGLCCFLLIHSQLSWSLHLVARNVFLGVTFYSVAWSGLSVINRVTK